MKTIKQCNFWRFKQCHATIYNFYCQNEKGEDDYGPFTIFYSYTCPKIVIFPDGMQYKFTFENSRKEGSITGSRKTTKQCNQRLGKNYHDLPTFNLKKFENLYFPTLVCNYY